jgi:hypothetical protein
MVRRPCVVVTALEVEQSVTFLSGSGHKNSVCAAREGTWAPRKENLYNEFEKKIP